MAVRFVIRCSGTEEMTIEVFTQTDTDCRQNLTRAALGMDFPDFNTLQFLLKEVSWKSLLSLPPPQGKLGVRQVGVVFFVFHGRSRVQLFLLHQERILEFLICYLIS